MFGLYLVSLGVLFGVANVASQPTPNLGSVVCYQNSEFLVTSPGLDGEGKHMIIGPINETTSVENYIAQTQLVYGDLIRDTGKKRPDLALVVIHENASRAYAYLSDRIYPSDDHESLRRTGERHHLEAQRTHSLGNSEETLKSALNVHHALRWLVISNSHRKKLHLQDARTAYNTALHYSMLSFPKKPVHP